MLSLARERLRDERIHRQWTACLPYMTEDTFISFDEYRDRVTGKNIDVRPTEEILAELDELEHLFDTHGEV